MNGQNCCGKIPVLTRHIFPIKMKTSAHFIYIWIIRIEKYKKRESIARPFFVALLRVQGYVAPVIVHQ